jgi:hypothetical protein
MLDPDDVREMSRRHGVVLPPDVPPTLLALQGRDRDILPNGSHVGFYRDALYADPSIAGQLTGACRLIFSGLECTMHVQLAASTAPHARLEHGLLQAMPVGVRPARLVLWPYARFPFGMCLDYERKFAPYVAGEIEAPEVDVTDGGSRQSVDAWD